MRRCTVSILIVFMLSAVGAGAEPLRMGVLPVLDVLPLYVAQEEGLFEKQGLDVEFVPFMSALERDTAMQSGQLDGYFGDLLNSLLLINAGVPIRIVTVSYATHPGQRMFALVLGPGKEAAASMSIGYSRSTVIEYLLDRMSRLPAMQGIEQDRTEVKKIPIRMQMLLGGQLDAAVLPEPLVSLVESKGGKVLVTDEELDMSLTVLCLHTDWLGKRKAFLKAYEKSVEMLADDASRYADLMVERCRVPEPLTPRFIKYEFPEPHLPGEAELFQVQQWMLSRGMLDSLLQYDKVTAD